MKSTECGWCDFSTDTHTTHSEQTTKLIPPKLDCIMGFNYCHLLHQSDVFIIAWLPGVQSHFFLIILEAIRARVYVRVELVSHIYWSYEYQFLSKCTSQSHFYQKWYCQRTSQKPCQISTYQSHTCQSQNYHSWNCQRQCQSTLAFSELSDTISKSYLSVPYWSDQDCETIAGLNM